MGLTGRELEIENAQKASNFRLKLIQRLYDPAADDCDVFVRDAFEKGVSPSCKSLCGIFNRKLSLVLNGSAVARRKGIDEVVEARPQVVEDLSS